MKKTMLWGALITIISSQVQAETTSQTTPTPATTETNITAPAPSSDATNKTASDTAAPAAQNPQPTQNNQPSVQSPQTTPNSVAPQTPAAPETAPAPQVPATIQAPQTPPATQAPQTNSSPASSMPNTATPQSTQTTPEAPKATMPAVMNCEYKIAPEMKQIDPAIVTAWTEKAVVQAFDFDSAGIDAQMQKLQNCFTDQGWQGFNNALQKSGNIEAIKTQKLTVSSQLDGKVEITEAKDSQWKLTAPIQVVYQNDKEKVTQLLNLNVTVGRKVSGDLGIVQMIATPKTAASQDPSATTSAPASATPPAQEPAPVTPAETPTGN